MTIQFNTAVGEEIEGLQSKLLSQSVNQSVPVPVPVLQLLRILEEPRYD